MADLPSGIPVLEIGPGLGTLTQKLLSLGHAVFAVEIDRRLEKHLREELALFVDSKQLNLLRADAVKYPTGNLPENIDLYAVVANLPYAISSAWMEGLLGSAKLPTRMVMMLQKEAADRMLAHAGTKEFNALSIFLQSCFQSGGAHSVPGQCFYPAPSVDSVLLRMDRLPNPVAFSQEARKLVRRIFTQRRKQIGSLIKNEPDENRKLMQDWLLEENLCPTIRPEKIEVAQWRTLARQIP